ncbi:hypothetical protein KKA00_10255 [bacterium]|nr:hypothetical protein [bacterium]MBU1652592.1 hypothetical protein [bacterium]MBU1880518.1 hypothetical protein [bacterium]
MGINLKSIVSSAADLLPGGTIVRSLVEGAGHLLVRKAAKEIGIADRQIDQVLSGVKRLAQQDPELQAALQKEEQARREFEMAFYGKAAELSPQAQLWRTITRPLLSFSLVGLFALGILIQYYQQVFISLPDLLIIPEEVVELSKWVVGFWFTSRGVEKIIGLMK